MSVQILSTLATILLVVTSSFSSSFGSRPADPPPSTELSCKYDSDYTHIEATVKLTADDLMGGTPIISFDNPLAPGEGWDFLDITTSQQYRAHDAWYIETVTVSYLESPTVLATCTPAIPKLGDLSFIPGAPGKGVVSYYVGAYSRDKPWTEASLVVFLESELEVPVPKQIGRTNIQVSAKPGTTFRAEVRATWLGLPLKTLNTEMFRMPGGSRVFLPLVLKPAQPSPTPTPTVTPTFTATPTATPTPMLFPIVGDDLRGPWVEAVTPAEITVTVASGLAQHIGQTLTWGVPSSFHADYINDAGVETQWLSNTCGNAWLGLVVEIPYNGSFQLRLKAKVTASSSSPGDNWLQIGLIEESAWVAGGDVPTPINADLLNTEWQTLSLDLPNLQAGRYIAMVKIGALCTDSIETLLRDMTIWG